LDELVRLQAFLGPIVSFRRNSSIAVADTASTSKSSPSIWVAFEFMIVATLLGWTPTTLLSLSSLIMLSKFAAKPQNLEMRSSRQD
jgi:hypothetical protein